MAVKVVVFAVVDCYVEARMVVVVDIEVVVVVVDMFNWLLLLFCSLVDVEVVVDFVVVDVEVIVVVDVEAVEVVVVVDFERSPNLPNELGDDCDVRLILTAN